MSRAMAANENPLPVQDAGLGALANLFNNMNGAEDECFQYNPAAAKACWLGFLVMRSVTRTVANQTIDKPFCNWAMWVLSPHALFTDDGYKEKEDCAKKEVAYENAQTFIDKHAGSRLWNLSPNSFVKYANHVCTLYSLAGEIKHRAFNKMLYREFTKLRARGESSYDKWLLRQRCSKSTVDVVIVLIVDDLTQGIDDVICLCFGAY